MYKKVRNISSSFHLILFCLILTNNILFVHSHKLANGQIIVHAHPFFPQDDGTPTPHQHQSADYVTLGKIFQPGLLLSNLLLFDFQIDLPDLVTKQNNLRIRIDNIRLFHYNHRGPPIG